MFQSREQVGANLPLMTNSGNTVGDMSHGKSPSRDPQLMVDQRRFLGNDTQAGFVPGGLNRIPEQHIESSFDRSLGSPRKMNSTYYTAGSASRTRRMIDLDGTNFIPSASRGFYVRAEVRLTILSAHN